MIRTFTIILLIGCLSLSCKPGLKGHEQDWGSIVVGDWYNHGSTRIDEYDIDKNLTTVDLRTHFEISFSKDNMFVFNTTMKGLTMVATYKVSRDRMFFIREQSGDTISIYRLRGNGREFILKKQGDIKKFKRLEGVDTLSNFLDGKIDSTTYHTAIKRRMDSLYGG